MTKGKQLEPNLWTGIIVKLYSQINPTLWDMLSRSLRIKLSSELRDNIAVILSKELK